MGQRVIAIHPKTREIHDGSVLTVDHSKCRVQFDRQELGVEFVMVRILLLSFSYIGFGIIYSDRHNIIMPIWGLVKLQTSSLRIPALKK